MVNSCLRPLEVRPRALNSPGLYQLLDADPIPRIRRNQREQGYRILAGPRFAQSVGGRPNAGALVRTPHGSAGRAQARGPAAGFRRGF
jgi:hypothetical protein